MNHYPAWKYITTVFVLSAALFYALPNFWGETPTIQISNAQPTCKVDMKLMLRVEAILAKLEMQSDGIKCEYDETRERINIHFSSVSAQLQAHDLLQKSLNSFSDKDPDYNVSLNLIPSLPSWMKALGWFEPRPMRLGLDLRGGIHLSLRADMEKVLSTQYNSIATDISLVLHESNIPVDSVGSLGSSVTVSFPENSRTDHIIFQLHKHFPNLDITQSRDGGKVKLTALLNMNAIDLLKKDALNQNLSTLLNRLNALGISEPTIYQQGIDEIVVQLPGMQDITKAKELLGRTAKLEMRMVNSLSNGKDYDLLPPGLEIYLDRNGEKIAVYPQALLTGDNLKDAQPGRDVQTQQPVVNLKLDVKGSQTFRTLTRNNIGKRLAILLIENDKGEVVTAPVIRSEISGGQVQISGAMTMQEAADTALLLRSGTMAAPMSITEERLIGPSLGKENIVKGCRSTLYGFLVIIVLTVSYYHLFGFFSSVGLTINLVLLIALLSILQATLTLPGIAAIALTLGMAIDSNVLINERIREELHQGSSPHIAIRYGFKKAWNTILDSNLTALIVGLTLLIFGSGPIRGFAMVHCLGVLTSLFSSVFMVRLITNFWYRKEKDLAKISIG